ncbi:MAG TPA: hypothetical protein PLV92_23550, partial [Pirellulaceae bacterium]|nr:hypothetical protein [Pirellulaceae bacterium]
ADELSGDVDDDLLIAGFTTYDDNDRALEALLAEWRSPGSYAQRLARLQAGASRATDYPLVVARGAAQTVFDDFDVDSLAGRQGADAFFANIAGGGVLDVILDRAAVETPVDIDA